MLTFKTIYKEDSDRDPASLRQTIFQQAAHLACPSVRLRFWTTTPVYSSYEGV